MFDAILFDLDGTLIDTESLAMNAGLAAFIALGYPVDEDFMHSLVGVDLPNAGRMIAAAYPNLEVAALNAHWQQGFENAMDKGLLLKPGAAFLLAARVLPMAVVTSSGRREAHHKLNLTGIAGAFADVITVDDVQSAKPAPEPYLLAAKRMGILPSRCLVFEDSETGAESAYRAGCYVVQVPDVVPSEGRWAHHLAVDLLAGARLVGLI